MRNAAFNTLYLSLKLKMCDQSVTNGVQFTFSSASFFSPVTYIKNTADNGNDLISELFLKVTELKVKGAAMLQIPCCFYFTYSHALRREVSYLPFSLQV